MANIVIVDGGAGGMVIATKLSRKRDGVLVEGKIAHLFNTSLYRRHLIKLHGIFKGTLLIFAKGISRIILHLKLD